MKKILLASTALVGMAGAAAAEITLSGYAEIGIFGGDLVETQFHNDWQVNFNFSTETDNGLSIGGKVQIEETNGANATNGGLKIDDEAFWVSGTFGKITLGETDGAFDWALTEIYSGTSIFDDHSTHSGAYWFTGLDGGYNNQIMRYEYSFGDFAVAVSVEQDDDKLPLGGLSDPIPGDGITMDTIWAIGGKWSGDMGGNSVSAGLGYTSNGSIDIVGLSAGVSMPSGFSVNLGYTDFGGTMNDNWFGIAAAYTAGPLLVGVNYGEYDSGGSGFGLVANYDLGGGVVAMAGYGSSDVASFNGNGSDTFSLGLGMSF
ncbi:MAG: porin [Albidovulum sp.]